MNEPITYTANRGGAFVHVTVEPGSQPQQQRWRELGEHLHKLMDGAIAEAGLIVPEHPEDREHNVAVGRAIEMIQQADAAGDQQGVREAIAFYNAYADAAGYPGIALVRFPLRHCSKEWCTLDHRIGLQIDIGTALPRGMIAQLLDGELAILTAGDWVRPGFEREPPSMWTPAALIGRAIRPIKGGAK